MRKESSPTTMVRDLQMATYRCPYCNTSITHRAELAGARVACSQCRGRYYEPTDPLPGVSPIKANEDETTSAPMASLAASPLASTNVDGPAGQDADQGDAGGRSKRSPDGSPRRIEIDRKCYAHSRWLVKKRFVISWDADENRGAKVGMTKNCPKEEGNDIILKIALKLVKKKWPEIYPLLQVRMDRGLTGRLELFSLPTPIQARMPT